MKTPDEIKKGLSCMNNADIECNLCPYRDDNYLFCSTGIIKDATACIQQLEQDKLELSERVLMLEEYVRHLTSEKEALLKDLRATDPCDNCKHCGTAWECDGDCSFCYHSETCHCRECDDNSHWEWVGIKEEDK